MTSESLQVVASSFDQSGQILASVIPSLDIHKLRIHNVSASSNEGSQISEHSFDRGVTVQCLKWISLSKNQPKKKRKRVSGVDNSTNSLEDSLVALGTNNGSILLFSPATGSVVNTLTGGHSLPITGLSTSSTLLLSCDSNGTICEWNINKKSLLRTFTSSEPDVNLVYPGPEDQQLLLASTNVFLVDLASSAASKLPKSAIIKTFPGFVHPVSDVLFPSSNQELFLCSSKNERNISVLSLSGNKPSSILVSQSDVESISLNEDDSALAAINDDGLVEIFTSPLDATNAVAAAGNNSRRSRGKSLTNSTKSSIQIKITRPAPSKELVKVSQVVFHDDHITLNWLENASVPVFEQVRWKDEDGKPLSGLIEITRARRVPGLDDITGKSARGNDKAAPTTYNEATAVVTSGKDVHNLESDKEGDENDDDDEDDDDEETLADRLDALNTTSSDSKLNGSAKSATKSIPKAEFATPGSFAVILNQALRTNDRALLESCLVNRDETMVKVSVQRLDSSLAVTFLERLAEKLARSPSRAGQLNIWIKWVMISHGGYLVTLPNLLKTLSSLHSTVSERVTTLPRLLALQGRLELLNSQMEIRRDLLAESRRAEEDDNEEEDEAAVEYVEEGTYIMNGEEDFDDNDDDEDADDDDEDLVDDISAFTNGTAQDDFEEDIIMGDDDEGYSDLEAVETMAGDDDEDDDEDDEDEIEQLVSKPKKPNGRARR
ncbi:Utp5p [Sugiyamaella lignohabitans]|uniref:Utp5p n=1 Tax=Sugiyamaella lignohabitans TaxID=796027 RepID=A0A167DGU6_9ASCO|nr:Utp5p [Sugiyamaella lignohabitans]ANB12903.1 Utp5p [Sugiyamaella lignohabitans]